METRLQSIWKQVSDNLALFVSLVSVVLSIATYIISENRNVAYPDIISSTSNQSIIARRIEDAYLTIIVCRTKAYVFNRGIDDALITSINIDMQNDNWDLSQRGWEMFENGIRSQVLPEQSSNYSHNMLGSRDGTMLFSLIYWGANPPASKQLIKFYANLLTKYKQTGRLRLGDVNIGQIKLLADTGIPVDTEPPFLKRELVPLIIRGKEVTSVITDNVAAYVTQKPLAQTQFPDIRTASKISSTIDFEPNETSITTYPLPFCVD